jgi:hypothetical protein
MNVAYPDLKGQPDHLDNFSGSREPKYDICHRLIVMFDTKPKGDFEI